MLSVRKLSESTIRCPRLYLNLILLIFSRNSLQGCIKFCLSTSWCWLKLSQHRCNPSPSKHLGNCVINCGHTHILYLVLFEHKNYGIQAHSLCFKNHSNWRYNCMGHYIHIFLIIVWYLIVILFWCGYQQKHYFRLLLDFWFSAAFVRVILWRSRWFLSFRRDTSKKIIISLILQ